MQIYRSIGVAVGKNVLAWCPWAAAVVKEIKGMGPTIALWFGVIATGLTIVSISFDVLRKFEEWRDRRRQRRK